MIVNSIRTLAEGHELLDSEFSEHKYFKLTLVSGKKRSLSANAISHVWYHALSEHHQADMTEPEYKAFCKYHFGMSLLSETEPEYVERMRALFLKHSYEDRLFLIEKLAVTSLMKREQMTKYLTAMKNYFEPKGFHLPNKDDL